VIPPPIITRARTPVRARAELSWLPPPRSIGEKIRAQGGDIQLKNNPPKPDILTELTFKIRALRDG
jgi:hypothetical protein